MVKKVLVVAVAVLLCGSMAYACHAEKSMGKSDKAISARGNADAEAGFMSAEKACKGLKKEKKQHETAGVGKNQNKSLVDVTISDAAAEDGNVSSARVVERGDAVYGVVKYGKAKTDATGSWGNRQGHGHAYGRGRHNFGRNTKVEFTGIAAEDIESVALNSVDGKLQFEVTKTDGTKATFDVPEKNKPGADTNGDDNTAPVDPGDDDDTAPVDPGDDDNTAPVDPGNGGDNETPVNPGDDDDTTPVDPGDDTTTPDFTNYTDSASLITEAWNKFNANDYSTAQAFAEELISRYAAEAAEQQASLSGFASSSDAADYWALNDVATAYFILGKIYAAQNKDTEAKTQFEKIIDSYSYAQCWDTQGWFWKVAQGAQEEIDKL